jgi:hypothetical protein
LSLPLDMALLAFKKGLLPATWLENVLPGVGINVKSSNSEEFATKLKNWFKKSVEPHYEQAPGQGSDQESVQKAILAHIPCRDALENLKEAGVDPSGGEVEVELMKKALEGKPLDSGRLILVEAFLDMPITVPVTAKDAPDGIL